MGFISNQAKSGKSLRVSTVQGLRQSMELQRSLVSYQAGSVSLRVPSPPISLKIPSPYLGSDSTLRGPMFLDSTFRI